MKAEKVSAPRLMIYRLLVDGLGQGTGISAPSVHETLIAKGMKISRKRVYEHVNALKQSGYIKQIRGTNSPALYERGKYAAVLDELAKATCHPRDNPPNGGGRNVQNCCNPDKYPPNVSPIEVYIPSGEAHVDGRYVFPVMRVGELYEPFRVRDDTGEVSMMTVWESEPKKLENGVIFYCGVVPILGGIKIQFWQGPEKQSLHIWPTPVELVPGRVRDAPEDLAAKAQDVANWLGRFGGWRLGDPEFIPNKGKGIHYACNDPAIMGNFPLDFKGAIDSHNWVDSTPPPRAYETDEAERMDAVIGFAAITRDIKQTQAALAQNIDDVRTTTATSLRDLDERSAMLVRITGNLQMSMENLATASAHLIEHRARETMTLAEILSRDPGEMFG